MNEWKDICLILEGLLGWLKIKKEQITTMKMQCIADVKLLEQQRNHHQMLLLELDAKKPVIQSSIATVKSTVSSQTGWDTSSEASMQSSDIAFANQDSLLKNMLKLATNLEEEWQSVQRRSSQLENQVNHLLPIVYELQDQVASCREMLKNLEIIRDTWKNVGDLPTESLQDHIVKMKHFQSSAIQPMANSIAKLDLQVKNLRQLNMGLPSHALNKVDEIHMRWKLLQVYCSERIKQLLDAARDFGPNSQHFLTSSVEEPWERFVAESRVPFYINHLKRVSTWDHPKMTELMESLYDLNNIRLAAYRTAMKVRRLQKALCLDLLPLKTASEAFKQHKLCSSNKSLIINDSVGVLDIIGCLTTLYDCLERDHDTLVNVPLCVDMCLNWMLNVYDIKRQGKISSLSFKIGIISLCNADLEEKCRYIFSQAAASTGLLDQSGLSGIIRSFMQVAWQLGESKAFGGCNTTASMLSYHQSMGSKPEFDVTHFIEWMKFKPQSIVWLCVFHRLAASENVSHPVRCSMCREFPIVGFRFRSLRHFNYDICQSCFFSGAVADRNLLHYPMAEHCIPATSMEKIKDFAKVIKNKLKGRNSKKYIGYLPLDTGIKNNTVSAIDANSFTKTSATYNIEDISGSKESLPITGLVPKASDTEETHAQIQQYAKHLACLEEQVAVSSLQNGEEDEHRLILQYCEAEGLKPSGMTSIASEFPHQPSVLFSHKTDEIPFSGSYVSSSRYALPPPLPLAPPETKDTCSNRTASAMNDYVSSEVTVLSKATCGAEVGSSQLYAGTTVQQQHSDKYKNQVQLLEDHNRIIRNKLNELRVLIQDVDPAHPVPCNASALHNNTQPVCLFSNASGYINELLFKAGNLSHALEGQVKMETS